jgi:hypothetical protein
MSQDGQFLYFYYKNASSIERNANRQRFWQPSQRTLCLSAPDRAVGHQRTTPAACDSPSTVVRQAFLTCHVSRVLDCGGGTAKTLLPLIAPLTHRPIPGSKMPKLAVVTAMSKAERPMRLTSKKVPASDFRLR